MQAAQLVVLKDRAATGIRKAWKNPFFRIAITMMAGAPLGLLCELAPSTFQDQCHAAAKIVGWLFKVVLGVGEG